MKLRPILNEIKNGFRLKSSLIIHFISIWLIVALSIHIFLPRNVSTWRSVGLSTIIGFLISLFVALMYYRKSVKEKIRSASDFESLTQVEKGERFFKELGSSKHVTVNFISNFILFFIIGLSSLTDYGNIKELLLCVAYAAIVAIAFSVTRYFLFKRWRNHHRDD